MLRPSDGVMMEGGVITQSCSTKVKNLQGSKLSATDWQMECFRGERHFNYLPLLSAQECEACLSLCRTSA